MLAFVDGRTALLGTKSVIAAALDRSQETRISSLAEDNDLYASANELSADNDFWLVSNVSEEARKDPAFIFHKVSSFASGYRLENGIHYSIHLNADDESSAKATSKQLHAALSQVNAYFPGALPTRPGLGLNEILANMKVSLDESDVHAWSDFGRTAIPKAPQQIAQLKLVDARPVVDANVPIIADERTMKMIRTAPVTGYMPPLPTMPNVPPPPVKRVVRIEGLEDGIREIPYTQSRK